MRYRMLGQTGLKVSVIGIGTWQLGGEWGRVYNQSDADAIFDEGAATGINLIDTAECYGDHTAEKLIGDYMARHERSKWIIATKFGHHFKGFLDRDQKFSVRDVREQLEDSLRCLHTDYIDLYQFHSGTDDLFQNDELWAMLAEQKKAGKIRHLGISIMQKGSELQAREARQVGAEVLQVVYNRLDWRPEQLYFPHAERDKLGILARVPLASGLLSGKYSHGSAFASGDVRSTYDAEKMGRDFAEVSRIQNEELPPGIPMSRWALAWCLKKPCVTAVIPGCKDATQVRANASAADLLAD